MRCVVYRNPRRAKRAGGFVVYNEAVKGLFNKTFYRFFFGFVAVVAGTLFLVLIIGGQ
jgi:hypothetical protein